MIGDLGWGRVGGGAEGRAPSAGPRRIGAALRGLAAGLGAVGRAGGAVGRLAVLLGAGAAAGRGVGCCGAPDRRSTGFCAGCWRTIVCWRATGFCGAVFWGAVTCGAEGLAGAAGRAGGFCAVARFGAAGAATGFSATGRGCVGLAGAAVGVSAAFFTDRMALTGAGLVGAEVALDPPPLLSRVRILPASDSLIELL